MKTTLTIEEASLGLASIVALSDGTMDPREAAVLRSYFASQHYTGLEEKATEAGIEVPQGLSAWERDMEEIIGAAPRHWQLRTLAVSWLLARADQVVVPEEFMKLKRLGDVWQVPYPAVADYIETNLRELPSADAEDIADLPLVPDLDLRGDQLAIAVASLVAFEDGVLSDEEATIMRRFYSSEDADQVETKVRQMGIEFPSHISALGEAIGNLLAKSPRETQVRALAVALLLAECSEAEPLERSMARVGQLARRCAIPLTAISAYAENSLVERGL